MAYSYDRRTAMEHPTEDARKKYLHEHPQADPHNHSVSKGEGRGESGGAGEKDEGAKAEKAKSFKNKSQMSWAHGKQLAERLSKQLDRLDKLVSGYKTSDPKKAKEVAEKMESDAKSALTNLELAVHHAESSHNLSGKDKSQVDKAKKELSKLKEAVEKGVHHPKSKTPDMLQARSLAEAVAEAAWTVSEIHR